MVGGWGLGVGGRLLCCVLCVVCCVWVHLFHCCPPPVRSAFGNNLNGKLGVGSTEEVVETPSLVLGLPAIASIRCSVSGAAAVSVEGELFVRLCWDLSVGAVPEGVSSDRSALPSIPF